MWVWMGCVHSTLVVHGHALAIVLLVPAVHVQFCSGWVMSPLYILLPVLIFFFYFELLKQAQLQCSGCHVLQRADETRSR